MTTSWAGISISWPSRRTLRGTRRLFDQPAQGSSRPCEGHRFEDFAEQGDEDDFRGDERLPDHQRRQARLGQRQVGTDPTP